MPKLEIFELHPTGWESDPSDEYFKLSTLDYCVGQVYTNYALFFKLPDAEKPRAVDVLRRGLEVTLSQCRQLVGRLEEHPDGSGGLCFHKRREDTVQFHVQWLDGPEDRGRYPSFEELERRHFVSKALGGMDTWCVSPMTYGEKPEAQPRNRPKASAFKASFIEGGLVFMMHHHHYGNDVMGWAGEMHQLAENCAAIFNSTPLPPWDKACLDLSRVTKPDLPEDQRVEGPVAPLRHPDHRPGQQWLLFHLPKSKTAELKKLASPEDGSYWISSYDAYMAYIWRILSKHRARLFKPDLDQKLLWGEAVDMRRRFHSPSIPPRIQGNVLYVALSIQSPVPQLSAREVISEAPLSHLAWYIRQLTSGVTQESVDAALESIAPIADKTTLFLRTDGFPPLSNFTTEWRDTKVCDADFGFARPHAFRFPFDTVTAGLAVVLPVRTNGAPAGDDEGNEFSIGFEKELADDLINDPEWNRYFEFRGVDAEQGSAA